MNCFATLSGATPRKRPPIVEATDDIIDLIEESVPAHQ